MSNIGVKSAGYHARNFENYIETTFNGSAQADFKFKQFELNYRQYFPVNLNAPLLDIGVGRGEMLSCMKNWHYENYQGIDISASTINYCHSLGFNCQLVDNSVYWLGKYKKHFGLITLMDVLEHIPKDDVVSLLSAIHGSLKENGVFIIQLPNMQGPDAQLQMYNDITHLNGYIEHSLRQVLLADGVTEIQFLPFNDSIFTSWKEPIRILLRSLYWKGVRLVRKLNGNINPKILTPTFVAVAIKS